MSTGFETSNSILKLFNTRRSAYWFENGANKTKIVLSIPNIGRKTFSASSRALEEMTLWDPFQPYFSMMSTSYYLPGYSYISVSSHGKLRKKNYILALDRVGPSLGKSWIIYDLLRSLSALLLYDSMIPYRLIQRFYFCKSQAGGL